jgi:peptidyl-prolyl cis-trans isomerase B (cyclophilin B)
VASTRRDKELARQRAERQTARQTAQAQRTKQRRAVIASVLAVLVLAGVVTAVAVQRLGGEQSGVASSQETLAPSPSPTPSPNGAASTSPSAAALPPGTCAYEQSERPAAEDVPLPPTEGVEVEQVYDVTLSTDQGDIVFEADSAAAPCTINSLRSLAEAGYFDGTPCHRLTTQGIEVLQCGDPTGTGGGGPGYEFADENLEGATYDRGTVAMANAGPGTNGSQFFLVYGDSPLPPAYTPFGTITSGLEVLDEVAAAGSNPPADGAPVLPISLETVTVEPKA